MIALDKVIYAFVIFIVALNLYSTLMPEAQTAGDALNATGVPLGSLFVSGGTIFVIVMAGLVVAVVKGWIPGIGGKRK